MERRRIFVKVPVNVLSILLGIASLGIGFGQMIVNQKQNEEMINEQVKKVLAEQEKKEE